MKQENEDSLWMAYLDDELTPVELEQFQRAAGPGVTVRALAERQFESVVGDQFNNTPGCPDDVWRRVHGQLKQVAREPNSRRRNFWWRGMAVAALALFIATASVLIWQKAPSAISYIPGNSYAQLQAASEVAPNPAAVEDLLAAAGMPLRVMLPVEGGGVHEVRLAGAHISTITGSPYADIYFTCCGHPAKLLVALEDTPAAAALRAEADAGRVQGIREFPGYVAAAVGRPGHAAQHAAGLLQLLEAAQA
jgi:hypothetical protein